MRIYRRLDHIISETAFFVKQNSLLLKGKVKTHLPKLNTETFIPNMQYNLLKFTTFLLFFITIFIIVLNEVLRPYPIPLKHILIELRYGFSILSLLFLFLWKGVFLEKSKPNRDKIIYISFYLSLTMFGFMFESYRFFEMVHNPFGVFFFFGFPFFYLTTSLLLAIFFKTIKRSWE